jgi:hypothetical protein
VSASSVVALAAAAILGAAPPVAPEAPTPQATPTPRPSPTSTPEIRDPHLVIALESWQGVGRERTALFDDGTLVKVVTFRGIETLERRTVSPQEIDVVRQVCREALTVERRDVEDPSRMVLGDTGARRMRLEIAEGSGKVRAYPFDDFATLPLALGRARGAIEDLRARFAKEDPSEVGWDTKALRAGSLLKKRSDGVWYRVVHDDALDHDFELEELAVTDGGGSHALRLFVYRGDLPRLFENPERAGPGPTPVPPARR